MASTIQNEKEIGSLVHIYNIINKKTLLIYSKYLFQSQNAIE